MCSADPESGSILVQFATLHKHLSRRYNEIISENPMDALTTPVAVPLQITRYRPFGPLLRELRKGRGLSLEKVARALRTHKGYISGIENRKVAPPSPKFIARIARFYNIDEKDLLLLSYAEKAPRLIREHVMQALWPTPPKDPAVS